MDTFVEQIITIKKTGKTWIAYLLIALAAIILMTASYLFFEPIFLALDALIVFGAYKLYSQLNIEYEYIITNSSMDIDKIIAKSSRKRMISIDLTSVQRIEKFNGKIPHDVSNDCLLACNQDDENAVIVYFKEDGNSKSTFVFAPNERTREAMKAFLPRFVAENL